MNKTTLCLLFLMPMLSYANEQYGDWIENKNNGYYLSRDLVHKNLEAIINPQKDGQFAFGLSFPYENCFVSESYAEPFGKILVLGQYHEFSVQCVGEKDAVVFTDNQYVNQGIIDTLVEGNNICLTVGESKFCFSGKGVGEIKAALANKKQS